MAQATAAQVHALEKAHKQALVNLLQAIRFRFLIYQKLGKESKEWKFYAQLAWDIWRKWYARQKKYEASGGAPPENINQDDWNTPEGREKLKALAKKWDQSGEGIGFIPLIIWGIIAIAGMFTADDIVDELNTTTEEQKALIESTDKICKEHNFNAEECKAFMLEQNNAVNPPSTITGTLMKLAIGVGAGYLVLNHFNKKQSSTT